MQIKPRNFFRISELRQFDTILKLTPPFGWIGLWHIHYLERRVIYGARNFGLPPQKRFVDPAEARSLRFDPSKKGDQEVIDATLRAAM